MFPLICPFITWIYSLFLWYVTYGFQLLFSWPERYLILVWVSVYMSVRMDIRSNLAEWSWAECVSHLCVCEVRQLGRPVIIFITLATQVWLCFGSWVQSSLCVWIVHPKSWIPVEEFSLCRCELPWLISMPILGPTQASVWTGKLSEELLPNVVK